MALADFVVTETHEKVKRILDLVEEAQALSAEVVQQWGKVSAGSKLGGYPWPEGYSEAEFVTAISSLQTLMPDVLGDHGTNLYKLKTALS